MALRKGAEGAEPNGYVSIRTADALLLTGIAMDVIHGEPAIVHEQPMPLLAAERSDRVDTGNAE